MMFSLWGHFHVFNSHKLMICVCTFWKLYEIVGNCNAVKLKHYSISPLTFYRNIGEWRMGPRRSMRQARTPPWIPIMGLCFCPQTQNYLLYTALSLLSRGYSYVRLPHFSPREQFPSLPAISPSIFHTFFPFQLQRLL